MYVTDTRLFAAARKFECYERVISTIVVEFSDNRSSASLSFVYITEEDDSTTSR